MRTWRIRSGARIEPQAVEPAPRAMRALGSDIGGASERHGAERTIAGTRYADIDAGDAKPPRAN